MLSYDAERVIIDCSGPETAIMKKITGVDIDNKDVIVVYPRVAVWCSTNAFIDAFRWHFADA